MCGESTTVRQSSWAPIVGQKRLSSAFSGDTLWYHSRRKFDQRAQVWNSEGKDIKTSARSAIGGAKKGESGDRRRGYSELFSSESKMPTKQFTPTIAKKRGEGQPRTFTETGVHTVADPYTPIPRPEPADHHGRHAKSRRKVDSREQSHKYKHRALKEVHECPLWLIVRILRIIEPGVSDGVYEIYNCLSPRGAYLRACDL